MNDRTKNEATVKYNSVELSLNTTELSTSKPLERRRKNRIINKNKEISETVR